MILTLGDPTLLEDLHLTVYRYNGSILIGIPHCLSENNKKFKELIFCEPPKAKVLSLYAELSVLRTFVSPLLKTRIGLSRFKGPVPDNCFVFTKPIAVLRKHKD